MVLTPLREDDDRVARPLLTLRETAWSVDVPESTLRGWARGYRMRDRRRLVVGEPVITAVRSRKGDEAVVPFIGIAEALVLTAFRRTGVPLQRIRPALDRLREETGLQHALASERLFSDGAEVLYDYAEQHPNDGALAQLTVVRSGQRVLADVVQDYLRLVTFDGGGWPSSLLLPGFREAAVLIDPKKSFGRPMFVNGGARVEDVLDRWRAGESFEALAADFGVPAPQIEDAARASSARAAAA